MFGQQPQTQEPAGTGIRRATNIFALLVNGHATCLAVFLRHSFGSEALGLNGIAAVVIMVLYMAAYGESRGMHNLFGFWFIALILQRIRTFWLSRKGVPLHSYYAGYPFVGSLLTLGLSDSAARFMEMIVCVIGGTVIAAHDPVLGRFVALGFVSLMLKNGIDNRVDRMKLRQMRDAEIEQRYLAERFRSGRF